MVVVQFREIHSEKAFRESKRPDFGFHKATAGECKARLDSLLTVDPAIGRSRLAWLQQSVASSTPPTVLVTLEKRAEPVWVSNIIESYALSYP
jgi:hypothetical protein